MFRKNQGTESEIHGGAIVAGFVSSDKCGASPPYRDTLSIHPEHFFSCTMKYLFLALVPTLGKQWQLVAYLDDWFPGGKLLQAQVAQVRGPQDASSKELRLQALNPSILDMPFNGEL
jgi:hypothetical protein